MRSKFPDLIFREWRITRYRHLIQHFKDKRNWNISDLQLDRATVFITHRCNLFCRYCNGPHLNPIFTNRERKIWLKREFTIEKFASLIEQFQQFGLKYVHFTGGEATLNRHLPEFVKIANHAGMMCALTTNGTAPAGVFRRLIENGLYEIRISIDSVIAERYDDIVRVQGAFNYLKSNLQEIVRMRDEENYDVFLILNSTTGVFNYHNLRELIKTLLSFKPDDIKLLVVAEEKDVIQQMVNAEEVTGLLSWVEREGPAFELLPLKIKSFLSNNYSGLKDQTTRATMSHCFVPVTERTVDAVYVYPCSIYLRYFGNPISSIKKSMEEQQMDAINFMKNHKCLEDEICLNYCTHCTRDYNVEVNQQLQDLVMKSDMM